MVVDGRWGPKMLLEPITKSSTRFSYVLFWTVDMWTFKFINYSTLVSCCPYPWGHKEGFYGVGTLEMDLDPLAVACPFEPLPWSMDVRYHYVDVVVCSTIVVVGLVVSRSLSIVDVMFAIKFVL